ncbi:MAG: hypothetical protein ACRBBP_11185, partial [Bdellovibrionales bacterium]
MSQGDTVLVNLSMAELFGSLIGEASKASGFTIKERSQAYIVSFLERCLFTEALTEVGGKAEPMIAEALLRAL